jgi:Mn2+/Fe2+ NRAMP family transporter
MGWGGDNGHFSGIIRSLSVVTQGPQNGKPGSRPASATTSARVSSPALPMTIPRGSRTSKQAAEALGPIAGRFAELLFTAGVLGVGFLAIPTLSGSAAYALAETFRWKEGLDRPLWSAPAFYAVVVISSLIGIGLNFAGVNPVRALYWSAVVNGLLAPFVLVAILIVASDRKLMCGQPSSMLSRLVVVITTLLMFGAGVGMFVF